MVALRRVKDNERTGEISLKTIALMISLKEPMVKLNRLSLPFDALQQLSAKIK